MKQAKYEINKAIKEMLIMNPLLITANEARYYRDSQTLIAEKMINIIKKYFSENSKIIASGLMGSNGTFFYPYSGK